MDKLPKCGLCNRLRDNLVIHHYWTNEGTEFLDREEVWICRSCNRILSKAHINKFFDGKWPNLKIQKEFVSWYRSSQELGRRYKVKGHL